MEANELMVGDLVLHDGKVIRVDAVHKRKIGYHKTKDKLTWLFNGQFQPIPLTPEILEKNGFTLENEVKHPARYIYNASYSNSVIVDFDCYNNGRGAMKCILAGVGLVSNSFIRIYGKDIYVHQLQHALKACGISKEIVV